MNDFQTRLGGEAVAKRSAFPIIEKGRRALAKTNEAADLAARCVERLAELRAAGTDYPLPLDRLMNLVSDQASAALQAKVLKHATFRSRIVLGHAKQRDAPVALIEDLELLAASEQLFTWVCHQAKTAGPPWNAPELKKLVPKPLQSAFERALRSRANASAFTHQPADIAFTAEEWLMLRLLSALRAANRSGAPTAMTLRELAERAGFSPVRDAAKLKKLSTSTRFRQYAVSLLEKTLDTPVVSLDQASYLARRPEVLAPLLSVSRSDKKTLVALSDLLKKASLPLRAEIQAAVQAKLDAGELLGPVGVLREGKTVRFFLLSDLEPVALRRLISGSPSLRPEMDETPARVASQTVPDSVGTPSLSSPTVTTTPIVPIHHNRAADENAGSDKVVSTRENTSAQLHSLTSANLPPNPTQPPVAADSQPESRGEFAVRFEAAYARLDRESGQQNQVSLWRLRQALSSWSREEFDAELYRLRLSGKYVLTGMQNRSGFTSEELAAGIQEADTLRLYVSLRR